MSERSEDYGWSMDIAMEPTLSTDPALSEVLYQLIQREPIFHRLAPGTTATDLESMTHSEFWEVGASGRRYSREYVLAELEKRLRQPADAGEDIWEATDFHCLELAPGMYLLTYTLVQDHTRKTRRTTIWQSTESGWKILFHQGTIVEAS